MMDKKIFIDAMTVATYHPQLSGRKKGRAILYLGMTAPGHNFVYWCKTPIGGYHAPHDEPALREYWEEVSFCLKMEGEPYGAAKLQLSRNIDNPSWLEREALHQRAAHWFKQEVYGTEGTVSLVGNNIITARAYLMTLLTDREKETVTRRYGLFPIDYALYRRQCEEFLTDPETGKLSVNGHNYRTFEDVPGAHMKVEPHRFWHKTVHDSNMYRFIQKTMQSRIGK